MRIAIVGGGGFLGVKLTHALAAKGMLRGQSIREVVLSDMAAPSAIDAGFSVKALAADVADPSALADAIPDDVDVVFHLAAVVSGQAEAEFDLGLRVNLHGAMALFERCRAIGAMRGAPPVVVFASSVAVFGGDAPEPIDDHTILNPQTSYGAQKAMAELLLTDYSRKGFLDGRGLRLPTVSVRPGKPNAAASSFISSIFREPLQGETAVCPTGPDTAVWVSSPRNTVANLVHGAELDGAALGPDRCLSLPGLTATVGEMVEAMRRVAGDAPVERIRWERDAEIERIVGGWKARFSPDRARRLGFAEDTDFENNIRWFLEEDVVR